MPRGREKKSDVAQPALGRSRGGLSTKIHLVAVDERTALAMSLSAGQANDAPPGEQLVAEVVTPDAQIQALCADRAYDSDALRAELAAAPTPKQAVIPPRANRRVSYAYDKERYRQRNPESSAWSAASSSSGPWPRATISSIACSGAWSCCA